MRQFILGLVFVFAALLGGCVSDDVAALRDDPQYSAGFGDGCTTAQEEEKSFSTKRVQDAYAFETSRGYKAGWRQGYFNCQNPVRRPDDGGRVLGNEGAF